MSLSLEGNRFGKGRIGGYRNPLVRPRSGALRLQSMFLSRSTWVFTPAAYLSLLLLVLLFPGLFFSLNGTSHADSSGSYTYDLALTTSGDINLNITPSSTGSISSGTISANVTTNSPTGYLLSVQAKPLNSGTAGNLTRVGSTTNPLTPTTGTIASPVVFTASLCNRWGFAIPTAQAVGIANGWNTSYVAQNNVQTNSASNTYKYAAVPTSQTTIRNQTTPTGGTTQSTNLYVSACAGGTGGNPPTGTYQGIITLTTTTTSLPTPTITSISPTSGTTAGGTTITITGTNFGTSANPNLTAAYIGATRTNNGSSASTWTGGYPCTNLTVLSQTSATCRTSAGSAGIYDFSIDSKGGWYTKTSAYTYEEPPEPLQTLTLAQCANMPMGSIKKFYDERDKKVYHVRKMPDEKCWMMDNLAYAGGISNGGTNTYGDSHTLTFATATNTAGGSAWTTATGITTRFVTTNNFTGSDQNSSGGQPIQNTTATLSNGTQCTASVTGSAPVNSKCLSYLYNWCSAAGLDSTTTPTCAAATNTGTGPGYVGSTAGGGMGTIGKTGGKGGESKGNTNAGNPAGVNSTANGTICPAGWRLPVGRDNTTGSSNDANNDWAILNGSMSAGTLSAANASAGTGYRENWQPNATSGGNETWRSSFGAVSAGSLSPDYGLISQSTEAEWWSSSLSSNYVYYAYTNSTSIIPGIYGHRKYQGRAVRCVMDSPPTYLQELTLDYYNTLSVGDTLTLKDARDNKSYHLKKMPDNKLWMMDNLAYAGGTSNGGSNYFGDEHALNFVNATSASPWTTATGITTRYVTTNNYTGSDQNSSGGQLIQNTTATLYNGTRCTNSVTGYSPTDSKCLSYLYNWCSAAGLDGTTTPTCAAATNTGTGTGYATTGVIGKTGDKGGESKGNTNAGNPSNVNSTTNGTICPAGWRLPVGTNNSTGSANNANNEWAILNGSMRNGTLSAANISQGTGYVENWQPNATSGGNATWRSSFGAVSSGYFYPGTGLGSQSLDLFWWSSSLLSSTNAHRTIVLDTSVYPGTSYGNKYVGYAVRCAFP